MKQVSNELIERLIEHFEQLTELRIENNKLNFEDGDMAFNICDYYVFAYFIEELKEAQSPQEEVQHASPQGESIPADTLEVLGDKDDMEKKKYKIIYADPAWEYVKLNFYQKKGVNNKVYDRMKIEDIKSLEVGEIADNNSLLFLWVTNPILKKGLEVMQSWGFEFTTIAFVWVKTYRNGKEITGMGRYTRSCVELCLLGKKGIVVKREDTNVPQIVYSNLKNHSKKPDEIRERITKLCGDVPRIELFARSKTEGWDVWGNEVNSDIEIKNDGFLDFKRKELSSVEEESKE